MSDLFAAAADEARVATAPLADRLRPVRLDDVVGQDHLLGAGRPLRVLIEGDRLPSVLLYGPPGTGKTTLARVMARTTAREFVELSAVSAKVSDVRAVAQAAEVRLGERSVRTVLFLDEVHRFSRTQQDALLPHVESGLLTLIGATTEDPSFTVTGPLRSRLSLFRLRRLDADALSRLIDRALGHLDATLDDDARAHLLATAEGDGRSVLTALELARGLAGRGRGPGGSTDADGDGDRHGGADADGAGDADATSAGGAGEGAGPEGAGTHGRGAVRIGLGDVEAAMDARALGYGTDEHYDVTSALIKSIRGSDPDAGLYWLARMLAAGDDPRYIARRLMILASEDVGMADPTALPVAVAAAETLDRVGLPEGRIPLAHAVVHLATAPKSNSAYAALGRAERAVAEGPPAEVPNHLRDSSGPVARAEGHGRGYEYPHHRPGGFVAQRHRPESIDADVYYQPSRHGAEAAVADRLAEWRTSSGRTPP